MQTFNVTLSLITGYRDGDLDSPILKYEDFEVIAEDEAEARRIAVERSGTKLSIYESWAD